MDVIKREEMEHLEKKEWEYIAGVIRRDVFNMIIPKKEGHFASAMSCVEIVIALYLGGIMNFDKDKVNCPERDRFIMSKGHGAATLYSVLAYIGVIPRKMLSTYCECGSVFGGVVSECLEYGLEFTTGSLGHGLSFAGGIALNGKIQKQKYHTYVLLGDGECQEGTVWEAAMSIAHYGLDNVTAIVDYNGIQASDKVENIMSLGEIEEKWKAFGWETTIVDGHNVQEIIHGLNCKERNSHVPRVVIARTVKGKGISFMENDVNWHYREMTDEQIKTANIDLGIGG